MLLGRDQGARIVGVAHPENVVLFDEWHVILTAFQRQRIDVIVLKGAALLETVYGDITSRPISDLDLLIRTENIEEVQELLLQKKFLPFPKSHTSFIKPAKIPVVVDIHTDLGLSEQGSLERIWDEALPAKISGVPALVLSHEHSIVYLISHLALSHGYPLAKWIQDIDLYIRKYEDQINWQVIIDRLKSNRLSVPAYYILLKTQNVFQTPVPEEVMAALKPKNKFSLQAKIVQLAMRNERPIPYIDYVLPIIIKNGPGGRIKIISTFLFPEHSKMMKRYNISMPALVYPYYLIRWITLGWKIIVGLVYIFWQTIKIVFKSLKALILLKDGRDRTLKD